ERRDERRRHHPHEPDEPDRLRAVVLIREDGDRDRVRPIPDGRAGPRELQVAQVRVPEDRLVRCRRVGELPQEALHSWSIALGVAKMKIGGKIYWLLGV